MTPKERVLTAISHAEPDRVPVGEWEYGQEVIGPVLGRPNLYNSGLATVQAYWAGRRNDVIRDWKAGLVQLVRHFGWDAVLVHLTIDEATPIDVPEPIGPDKWRTRRGDTLQYSPETSRMFVVERGTVVQTPATPPASMDPTDSELEVVRHIVRELGQTHFLFAAPQIGHPQFGYSDASVSEVETWVRLFEDPDRHRQNLLNWVNHPNVRRGIEIGKREGLDGIAYGCDYGCNTGPFMSPELFRHAILPGLAAFCSLVHEHGMVMLHHACGNNQVLMDMIVEAGVDVYQSIQPEMDIKTLKKRYGKRITLWGGFPSGDLILSNPAQVRKLAAEQIEALKPGGGFIFGTSHSIMPAAKHENYAAMLDALAEHGDYRH